MRHQIGIDLGTSGVKITDDTGDRWFPAEIGYQTRLLANPDAIEGARRKKTRGVEGPLRITVAEGHNGRTYLVGAGAHEASDPIHLTESTERLASPAARALFYAALSGLDREITEVDVAVGLPLSAITGGDEVVDQKEAIREWMLGTHSWTADGIIRRLTVTSVALPTQASVALTGHLAAKGTVVKAGQEFGTLSLGAGTFEVQVMKMVGNRLEIQRGRSQSFEHGTKHLLKRLPAAESYTFAELNALALADPSVLSDYLDGYWSDLAQDLGTIWPTQFHKRLQFVLAVGGTVPALETNLRRKFNGKLHLADDSLFAVSRGLYGYIKQKAARATA